MSRALIRSESTEKLLKVLNIIKGWQSECPSFDESYLEKLLDSFEDQLKQDKNGYKKVQPMVLIDWLDHAVEAIKPKSEPTFINFILRFTGILSKDEKVFEASRELNVIDQLINVLNINESTEHSVKLSYLYLLTSVLAHDQGVRWSVSTKKWKQVVQFCSTSQSLYIIREGEKYMIEFARKIKDDVPTCEEVMKDILLPIVTFDLSQCLTNSTDEFKNIIEDKIEKETRPSFRLLFAILNDNIDTGAIKAIPQLLHTVFCIEPVLKQYVNVIDGQSFLELILNIHVLLLMAMFENSDEEVLENSDGLGSQLLELHIMVISRSKFLNAMQLSKKIQLYWSKLNTRLQIESSLDCQFEIQFTCIQLMPLFMFINKKEIHSSFFLELFINKVTEMTCEDTQRLCFTMKNMIWNNPAVDKTDLAIKGVLSVMENVETLNRDRAVLIFQSLMYVLKEFVPITCEESDSLTAQEEEEINQRPVTAEHLLSNVLEAIKSLVQVFKINWAESVESICLLKFCALLLKNPAISTQIAVKTLRVAKLAIENFMPPSLALLVNEVKGSSFVCVAPILYRCLHDTHWEIRDTCLEVVLTMAELAEIKYPPFQDILLDNNLVTTAVQISISDTEMYARSSAMKVLKAMVRIDRLWTECNRDVDVVAKVLELLKHETEGIIRREAVPVINDIYIYHKCSASLLKELYGTMINSAMYDLHWEVRVNALTFWENVIERLFSHQGMIDGDFPSVTFSKETKKIVTLTEAEIQTRLIKILKEMSELGCLNVLTTTLLEDPDIQVVKKSSQIINKLKIILSKHKVLVKSPETAKRKSSNGSKFEKRLAGASSSNVDLDLGEVNSEDIIDEICHQKDLNLLMDVYLNKKVSVLSCSSKTIDYIEPHVFLESIKDLDIDLFLNEKFLWMTNCQDDFDRLLDDMWSYHNNIKAMYTNITDCY